MKHFLAFIFTLFLSFSTLFAQSPIGSGNSLLFNGSSSFVNLGTNDRNISNKVTLEAWIKTTSLKHQWIAGKYNNPQDNGYQIFTQNGQAALAGRDHGGVYRITGYSTTNINDGKWHHIVGVVNINNWEIYVDGKRENGIITPNNNPVLSSNAPLTIGNYALYSDLYFLGEIDEVRIWNIARTAQEIRNDMCQKVNPSAPGLVGYYKLDEGSGTTTADLSSFNIPGTLNNFSATTAWRTSGAPIGDVSINHYCANCNANIRLGWTNNDTIGLYSSSWTTTNGIHLYKVNNAPNTNAGIANPASISSYVGVFSTGSNINYNLFYIPATINCSTDSVILNKRIDNAGTLWQQTGMRRLSNYFEKANETYRGEYIPQSRNSLTKVQINGNQILCAGTPVTLTATQASSYLWNTGQTTQSISVTNPGVYSVTAINDLGCSSSDSIQFTPKPSPIANAGPDVSICSAGSTVIGSAPIAGYIYSWFPAAGLSSTTVSNPNVTLINTSGSPSTFFYTLTATYNGCTTTDVVNVTVNPSAVSVPGNGRQVCSGEPTILGSAPLAGYSYSWSPATGLSDPTIANPVATLINPSNTQFLTPTYTLTVTNPFGCIATGSLILSVKPATNTDAGLDKVICSGETTSIGSTGNNIQTYFWSPATGLSSATVSNPTVTLGNTTFTPYTIVYYLTASSAGCSTTDSVRVTVNPQPVEYSFTDLITCSNEPLLIGPQSISGYSYSWSPATGLSNAAIAQPTITLTNNTNFVTNHIYALTITTPEGCSVTKNVSVNILPLPITEAGPDVTICSKANATLGVPAKTDYIYSWAPAIGLSSTSAANPTVTLINNTSLPISQTYTLTTILFGCTTSDQVTVTVNPEIIVNAGPDKTVCPNEPTIIGTPALPGYTYSWTGHIGISNPTIANPTFSAFNGLPGPSVGNLYLTATSIANGCSKTDTVTITINPRPLMDSIAGSPSVCPGVIGVDYHMVNPRLTAYQWLVQGGTITSGQGTNAITVNWGASGNAKVQAYTINTFGCVSDTVSFNVIINPLLITQKPVGPTQLCFYEAKNIHYQTPITTNGSFYTYQAFGGTITSANPSSAGVSVNWHAPGIGKLIVTETSTTNLAFCFGVSDTLVVTIKPSPDTTVSIIGNASACALSLQNTYTFNGAPGSTYTWTFNGNTLNDTDNEVKVDYPPAGNYTLSVLETNSFGCPGRLISRSITATPLPGILTINGSAIICPDDQLNISYSVTGLPGSTYLWKVTGGTITSGNGSNTIYVDFDNSRDKLIEVKETSSGNCIGSVFTKNALYDASTLKLASVSTSEKNYHDLELNITMFNDSMNTKNIDVYRREAYTNNAFQKIATIANTDKLFLDPNLDTEKKAYEYLLESMNECGTQIRKSVMHNSVKLNATAQENTKAANLAWNTYKGWGPNGVKVYEIYGKADNGNFSKILEVSGTDSVASILKTAPKGFNQCFRLKAVAVNGLVSWSNEVCINFENNLVIYNIVTANQDGRNDFFTVENIHLYPGNELTIYNRWGAEVFHKQDYLNDWAGTEVPDGTYFYYLKLADGRSFKGWFDKLK